MYITCSYQVAKNQISVLYKLDAACSHCRIQFSCVTNIWKFQRKISFGAYICPFMTQYKGALLGPSFFAADSGERSCLCFVQFLDFYSHKLPCSVYVQFIFKGYCSPLRERRKFLAASLVTCSCQFQSPTLFFLTFFHSTHAAWLTR